MTAADFIVMASGTATLEAMLLRKPMLVCYRLAPITYAIASRIVNVPHMALPNLLAGQRLVPELVQDEVTVTAIRDEILRYFSDPADFEARLGEFEPLHRELRNDASTTAAAAIKGLLNLPI
jgi:lipid-A-disaccharide synthase